MKRRLIINIGLLAGIGHDGRICLKGKEMGALHTLLNAYLVVEDGHFTDYGKMEDCPLSDDNVEVIDAKGGAVLPHGATHIHILSTQEVVNKSLSIKSVD